MQGKRVLTTDNSADFCLFLRDKCHIPYAATSAMLEHFIPLRITAFNMFRLALAIINYLPRFETRDITLEDLREDLPNTWVHVRIIDVDVREETPGRFISYIKVLCYTTILAGRVLAFRVPCTQMKYVFRALGLRNRIKEEEVLSPRELCSMYAHVHLGETQREVFTILGWKATGSEKKKNKELSMLRKRKDCSRINDTCVTCPLGKDACALACRQKSLRRMEEPNVSQESGTGFLPGSFKLAGADTQPVGG